MKNTVITQQRHHAYQVKLDLFAINVVLGRTTATARGLLLRCLLLMNGLLTLIPKTKLNLASKLEKLQPSPSQTSA